MANKMKKKEDENKIINPKKRFIILRATGQVLFFKTRSNFFLILSDTHNKCIFCSTSGIAKIGTKKKQKISKFNILQLVQSIEPYLKLYRIKNIKLTIKCRVSKTIAMLESTFSLLGYEINEYTRIWNIPHNGVRARKLRRI